MYKQWECAVNLESSMLKIFVRMTLYHVNAFCKRNYVPTIDYENVFARSILQLHTMKNITIVLQKRAHYGLSTHPPVLARFPAKV